MLSAVSFLTVLGPPRAPDARTIRWFPLVGAVLGAVLAATYWGVHALWPPLVAAVLVVAADLILTGALHFDGLADTADGLLPHMERQRRLVVMKEPTIGAFALVVTVVLLMARGAVFTDPEIEPLTLVAIWAMSRTFVAVVPAVMPYARADGLATPFVDGATRWLALWLVPCVAALIVTRGPVGGVAAAAATLTAVGLVGLARRRLGGFTGDVLGAVIVVSETAALLAIAARP